MQNKYLKALFTKDGWAYIGWASLIVSLVFGSLLIRGILSKEFSMVFLNLTLVFVILGLVVFLIQKRVNSLRLNAIENCYSHWFTRIGMPSLPGKINDERKRLRALKKMVQFKWVIFSPTRFTELILQGETTRISFNDLQDFIKYLESQVGEGYNAWVDVEKINQGILYGVIHPSDSEVIQDFQKWKRIANIIVSEHLVFTDVPNLLVTSSLEQAGDSITVKISDKTLSDSTLKDFKKAVQMAFPEPEGLLWHVKQDHSSELKITLISCNDDVIITSKIEKELKSIATNAAKKARIFSQINDVEKLVIVNGEVKSFILVSDHDGAFTDVDTLKKFLTSFYKQLQELHPGKWSVSTKQRLSGELTFTRKENL